MTNLDLMKQSIIKQIQNMDVEDFECFVDLIINNPDDTTIDTSETFQCEDCRKLYGKCEEKEEVVLGITECSIRFRKFARQEYHN